MTQFNVNALEQLTNITISRLEDFTFDYQFIDDSGDPVSTIGWSFVAEVKRSYDDAETLLTMSVTNRVDANGAGTLLCALADVALVGTFIAGAVWFFTARNAAGITKRAAFGAANLIEGTD